MQGTSDIPTAIPVVLLGLGPVGQAIARAAIEEPGLRVVGAVDPSRVGERLPALLDAPSAPPLVVEGDAAKALTRARGGVALHEGASTLEEALPDLEHAARAGVSVVSTCDELAFPWLGAEEEAERLDAACAAARGGPGRGRLHPRARARPPAGARLAAERARAPRQGPARHRRLDLPRGAAAAGGPGALRGRLPDRRRRRRGGPRRALRVGDAGRAGLRLRARRGRGGARPRCSPTRTTRPGRCRCGPGRWPASTRWRAASWRARSGCAWSWCSPPAPTHPRDELVLDGRLAGEAAPRGRAPRGRGHRLGGGPRRRLPSPSCAASSPRSTSRAGGERASVLDKSPHRPGERAPRGARWRRAPSAASPRPSATPTPSTTTRRRPGPRATRPWSRRPPSPPRWPATSGSGTRSTSARGRSCTAIRAIEYGRPHRGRRPDHRPLPGGRRAGARRRQRADGHPGAGGRGARPAGRSRLQDARGAGAAAGIGTVRRWLSWHDSSTSRR